MSDGHTRPHARRRRRVAVTAAAVLALHLLFIALLSRAPAARLAQGTQRVTLRIVTPPAPAAAAPVHTGVAQPPRSRAAAPSTRPHIVPVEQTGSELYQRPDAANPRETPSPAPIAAAEASPADPPASAPPPLLDTDATRRAIRASARAPSLGDALARSREEPERAGPNQHLAAGVRDAGKGDCVKGEYAGSGMGLLSLPFLALAAASGQCAK